MSQLSFLGPEKLWVLLAAGYGLTVLIEMPILLVGLSARHSFVIRVFAGLWLTACTYPIVVLVLPALMDVEGSRLVYLAVAETLAPVAECVLFWIAFGGRSEWGKASMWHDFTAITLANLASFVGGGVLSWVGEQGAV